MKAAGTANRVSAAIMGAVLLFLYLPLAVVALFSFHTSSGLHFPFEGFSLRWYRAVFGSSEFREALTNSLIVGAAVGVVGLILGTLAAYGVSRGRARARRAFALLFVGPITLPGLFVGIALLVFFDRLGVQLSLWTIAVAHLIYVFPYVFVVARIAIDRLDPALEEVAADLGANAFQVFRLVTLPLIAPILIGAACLAFALSVDEFVMTLFVSGPDSTLPLFIWSRLRRTIDPSVNTISTVLIVLSFLVWALGFLLVARSKRLRLAPELARRDEDVLEHVR